MAKPSAGAKPIKCLWILYTYALVASMLKLLLLVGLLLLGKLP